jgi:hypothetical protein
MYVHSQFAVKILAIDRTISPCHLTCGFSGGSAARQRAAHQLLAPPYRLVNIVYITWNAGDKPPKWQ